MEHNPNTTCHNLSKMNEDCKDLGVQVISKPTSVLQVCKQQTETEGKYWPAVRQGELVIDKGEQLFGKWPGLANKLNIS